MRREPALLVNIRRRHTPCVRFVARLLDRVCARDHEVLVLDDLGIFSTPTCRRIPGLQQLSLATVALSTTSP